jgi:hypothetical protein
MSAQQIFFSGLLLIVGYLAYRLYGRVWRNIRLGKEYVPDGEKRKRWSNLLLVAFGQRKMFKQVLPAIFHFFIYVAFLLTQIELIEIIADGISDNHRLLAAPLGRFYPVLISTIEILSVLALIATLIFLWRRNVKKVVRFEKPEMTGWPKQDANLILMGEIFLILAIMVMNGADTVLQDLNAAHYPDTGFWPSRVFWGLLYLEIWMSRVWFGWSGRDGGFMYWWYLGFYFICRFPSIFTYCWLSPMYTMPDSGQPGR